MMLRTIGQVLIDLEDRLEENDSPENEKMEHVGDALSMQFIDMERRCMMFPNISYENFGEGYQ